MSWVGVESYRFHPYEFLDVFFSNRRLLKIKHKRMGAHRFLVDIMKWRQIWMAESLLNCK